MNLVTLQWSFQGTVCVCEGLTWHLFAVRTPKHLQNKELACTCTQHMLQLKKVRELSAYWGCILNWAPVPSSLDY